MERIKTNFFVVGI